VGFEKTPGTTIRWNRWGEKSGLGKKNVLSWFEYSNGALIEGEKLGDEGGDREGGAGVAPHGILLHYGNPRSGIHSGSRHFPVDHISSFSHRNNQKRSRAAEGVLERGEPGKKRNVLVIRVLSCARDSRAKKL